MDVPRVQYVTSADGVRIAYTTIGHGAPLVFPANAWGDIEVFATSPIYGALPELVLSSGFQAVLYDGGARAARIAMSRTCRREPGWETWKRSSIDWRWSGSRLSALCTAAPRLLPTLPSTPSVFPAWCLSRRT